MNNSAIWPRCEGDWATILTMSPRYVYAHEDLTAMWLRFRCASSPRGCRYVNFEQGRTWFSNFQSTRRTPEQPHKQVKLGTLEYSGINQAVQNTSGACRQWSAIFFLNRSRDCSVYTTSKDGVLRRRQHRCSSALDFCSACSEWKE